MLDWQRPTSFELPRHKIYLTSLNQLIDRKIVVRPEVQTNNRIFSQCALPKKMTMNLQRTKSRAQIRPRKSDMHWNSKNVRIMAVESSRFGTSLQSKRWNHQQNEKQRVTYVSEHKQRLDNFTNPISKISLASAVPASELFNFSSQKLEDAYQSLQLKSERPLKQFLRKGSNMQKQIVISLLRNKLRKQRELEENKQYSNHQIIKMIQVFKGVSAHQNSKQKKRLFQTDRDTSPLRKRFQLRELKGWEQDEPLGEEEQNEQK